MTRAAAPRIRVGTSGWSYRHWRKRFYPEALRGRDWLSYYARRFHAVEVNATFYRLPEVATLRKWCDAVPEDFRFAVKASRYITHMKKLKDPEQTVPPFLDRVTVLGRRLGPLLFQLPPRWQVDCARLDAFISGLPNGYRYVFELRDVSWHIPEVYAVLERHSAALCVFQLGELQIDPRLTTELAYVRLHGPHAAYAGSYRDADLSRWACTLRSWRSKVTAAYCFFDNDQDPNAANDASRLLQMLSRW